MKFRIILQMVESSGITKWKIIEHSIYPLIPVYQNLNTISYRNLIHDKT